MGTAIGDLVLLENLNIFGNRLRDLPPEIENLIHLEYLDCHENRLTCLPEELCFCISMRTNVI